MTKLQRTAASGAAALLVIGAFALGAAVGRPGGSASAAAHPAAPVLTRNKYVCPMHPQIVGEHPDKCPICGMDLVAAKSDLPQVGLRVDAAELSALGIARVSTHQATLGEPLRTYGTVVADPSTLYAVDTKFDGWLRRLNVHSVGQRVQAGQVLYEIYSPDLVMKQQEYLRFRARRKQILQSVVDISSQKENEYVTNLLRESQKERQEFMRMDLGIDTIQQLEDTGTTIEVVKVLAQHGGVVTQLNAREGSFVTPAQPIALIADPASLWIDVVLAAGDLERVERGDPIIVTDTAGSAIPASIDFVSPVADNGRGHARAIIEHPGERLRLGSLVDVTIALRRHSALVVPASAVARTGHGDFVMLDRGGGHFLPIEVKLGIESAEGVEVLSGVQPGAQVASNAQFLLDAAASIDDTQDRRQPPTDSARVL